ncbi:leucine-rich repeat-containing protein 41 isoform X2 [Genypterus blacodes]|uniref:leucine-rich repeat-containing protein 41 isoform X2 n=1 Tax=Genypterus blacodes TaxID=154954 RepID=UPI003F766976
MIHEAYAKDVLRMAANEGYRRRAVKASMCCLRELCLHATAQHMAALHTNAVLDLPKPLIRDLVPHLNIYHLAKLQPAINQKGISTYSGWVAIIRDMKGRDWVIDVYTEEESKQEAMDLFFSVMFYGQRHERLARHISGVNIKSVLLLMAQHVKHFSVSCAPNYLQSLTTEQWPLLSILEKSVETVNVIQHLCVPERRYELYVLHRLLDHGGGKKLIVYEQYPMMMMAWLLHARGSQYVDAKLMKFMHKTKTSANSIGLQVTTFKASNSEQDQATPCKHPKLDSLTEQEKSGMSNYSVDPRVLCRIFTPSAGPSAVACPRGQIQSLHIKDCGPDSLGVLILYLPTWLCLRSLTLKTLFAIFRIPDVVDLARSLKQLSDNSSSSLIDLSIGVLPNMKLMETLLNASPNLRSLTVEIHPMPQDVRESESLGMTELSLEKLSVKVEQLQIDLHSVSSVLSCSPHLTSLHLAGMRLHTGSSHSRLLSIVSESNRCLRMLHLEDLNLSHCLPDILNLLKDCNLEELWLKDCRLFERCNNKEESLQELVEALRRLPSLLSLSLAQNRLAKSVAVLAELFSTSPPSTLTQLDISGNFIQAAELLEFTRCMEAHRPPRSLTVDLRQNPWDRNVKMWNVALERLYPVCNILVDGWKSRDTMADHLSNM